MFPHHPNPLPPGERGKKMDYRLRGNDIKGSGNTKEECPHP